MKNEDFITTEETEFPIGISGLFLRKDLNMEGKKIDSIKQINNVLYEVMFYGFVFVESDEISSLSGTKFDCSIFDLDDKSLTPGYEKKLSENIYLIFSDEHIFIKNIVSHKKLKICLIGYSLESEDLIYLENNIFLIEKDFKYIDGEFTELKIPFRIFINQNGEILYKGFCFNYQIYRDKLVIRKKEKIHDLIEFNIKKD